IPEDLRLPPKARWQRVGRFREIALAHHSDSTHGHERLVTLVGSDGRVMAKYYRCSLEHVTWWLLWCTANHDALWELSHDVIRAERGPNSGSTDPLKALATTCRSFFDDNDRAALANRLAKLMRAARAARTHNSDLPDKVIHESSKHLIAL